MNLGDRVKRLLASPKTEWPVIRAEPGTIGDVFRQYVVPFAAIPAVAGFVGSSIIGYSMMGSSYRVGIVAGVVTAAVSYALSLASVYILAMIVDALAPTFASRKDSVSAYKLAAYSYTASWVSGVFLAIPGLRFLTILGLYGFYLFFVGLTPMMGTPEDRRLPYTLAVVVAGIVLFVVGGTLLAALIPF
jgi:hypothetical protein